MEGLVNMMEETVLKKIDELWETTDGCKCQKCKLDIATYALNRLPPRCTFTSGKAYSQI